MCSCLPIETQGPASRAVAVNLDPGIVHHTGGIGLTLGQKFGLSIVSPHFTTFQSQSYAGISPNLLGFHHIWGSLTCSEMLLVLLLTVVYCRLGHVQG